VNEFFFGVVVEEEMKNCRKNAVLAWCAGVLKSFLSHFFAMSSSACFNLYKWMIIHRKLRFRMTTLKKDFSSFIPHSFATHYLWGTLLY
jgi:hypothetical protein